MRQVTLLEKFLAAKKGKPKMEVPTGRVGSRRQTARPVNPLKFKSSEDTRKALKDPNTVFEF